VRYILALLVILMSAPVSSETVFTVRGHEHAGEPWPDYPYEVIKIALDATVEKYGPYKIEIASVGANVKRAIADAQSGRYPNYFVKQSVSEDLMAEMLAVPFPVELGIVGYRVGFVSNETLKRLEGVKSLDDLRAFTVIQGIGWLDREILATAGFNVKTGTSTQGMARMAAANRAEIFFRGVNEIQYEWEFFKNIENIAVDKSVSLYYPLPRFFFTNKSNKKAAERIHEGILISFANGTLQRKWQEQYGDSVEFADLKNRKLFRVENPLLREITTPFEQYFYRPQ
jgi:hypothetical protein